MLQLLQTYSKLTSVSIDGLPKIFDYEERLERYYKMGYFSKIERYTISKKIKTTRKIWTFNHGDLLFKNIIHSDTKDFYFIDWEFTGLYLPGYDLAMLYTLLAKFPEQQALIF